MGNNTEKPNVLLIIIDGGRPDHFSFNGYNRQTTPFMDSLASSGLVYDDAFATAGWTLPSIASLFTGTYPSKHGAHGENHFLSNRYKTLAEVFSENGYRTASFCKSPFLTKNSGFGRGFTDVFDIKDRGNIDNIKKIIRYGLGILDKGATKLNKEFMKWSKINHQSPFFAYVHYNEMHIPFRLTRSFRQLFLAPGLSYKTASKIDLRPTEFYAGISSIGAEEIEILKSLYDQALKYTDTKIEQIVNHLKHLEILDNTMLLITSDHGEPFAENGHLGHGYFLNDTLIKVPLIMNFPKLFSRKRIEELVQTIDIFPTLIELLNLETSSLSDCQGVILPPFNNQSREFIISERYKDMYSLKTKYPKLDLDHMDILENDRKTAIRTRENKYIESELGNDELYEISKDPFETNNLISSRAEILSQLKSKLETWRASFTPSTEKGKKVAMVNEARKELRKMGYLTE